MIPKSPAQAQTQFQEAFALFQANQFREALALLRPLANYSPRTAETRHLLSLVFRGLGNLVQAEGEARTAVSLNPHEAGFALGLAETLTMAGKDEAAEEAFRKALALRPTFAATVRSFSGFLVRRGRADEALALTEPLAATSRDPMILDQHAVTLKALDRSAEALDYYKRWAALAPNSANAEHNLAATLADLWRHPESEAAARRAQTRGGDTPETWLVLARALQGQDRFEEAAGAFEAALARFPAMTEAHTEYAQLVWMQTADPKAATAALDRAMQTPENLSHLSIIKARQQEYMGDPEGAYETVSRAIARDADEIALQGAAARAANRAGWRDIALVHAETVLRANPLNPANQMLAAEAYLAVGRAKDASALIAPILEASPNDQYAWALQGTVWRLLGDERFEALYDYAAFVRPYQINTPAGWSSLPAYLADLAEGLAPMHGLKTHPVGQSLRHGTQTNQNLLRSEHPAVKAFPTAIDGAIREHMRALGQGAQSVRARNTGNYSIEGIWSVRLKASGYHTDHVHPMGWLSSACYITLPKAVEGEGREGWIKFGQPGIATLPALEPQHFVKPQPGRLVLFPSYMWHGTVPFSGDDHRLSVAFDLLPKPV